MGAKSAPAHQIGEFLVNHAPVTDRDDLEHAPPAVHGINDAKALHAVLPQPLEFTLQGFAGARLIAQGANRSLHAALYLRREVADDVGDVRWNVRPVAGHQRRLLRTGRSGSPNTSSKE